MSEKNTVVDSIVMDSADCWIKDGSSHIKKRYEFRQPIFGVSNTDQSYYEPRSSSIANLYKSAGNSERIPQYDFTDSLPTRRNEHGKEVIDVDKATSILQKEHKQVKKVATLRDSKGMDIAEISQLENDAISDVKDSIIDNKREALELEKQMKFVDLAKERLNQNTTENNSGIV